MPNVLFILCRMEGWMELCRSSFLVAAKPETEQHLGISLFLCFSVVFCTFPSLTRIVRNPCVGALIANTLWWWCRAQHQISLKLPPSRARKRMPPQRKPPSRHQQRKNPLSSKLCLIRPSLSNGELSFLPFWLKSFARLTFSLFHSGILFQIQSDQKC